MADFLDRVCACFKEADENISEATVLRVQVALRQAHGGIEMGYLGKRPALQRTVKIGESLQQHKPLKQVFEDAGARRAWGYRLMARK